MRRGRPLGRMLIGLVLAAVGALWTLQGAGLVGPAGGMNGQGVWILAGAVTAVTGALLAFWGYQDRPRP